MITIAVRLPDDIATRLDELARKTGRSKTYYIRESVVTHLDDIEDLYLAEMEMKEIRSGYSTTVPLEEVAKRYGLKN